VHLLNLVNWNIFVAASLFLLFKDSRQSLGILCFAVVGYPASGIVSLSCLQVETRKKLKAPLNELLTA